MQFSEKLIQLRKEKLLSQEELGEKLNVTRQTVSKWELGQTTPDMDKLVEMSKLFGVTLDELTSENEINDKNTSEKSSNTKRNVIIIVVVLLVIFVLVPFVIVGSFMGGVWNILSTRLKNKPDVNTVEIFDQAHDFQNQMVDNYYVIQNQLNSETENEEKQQNEDEEAKEKINKQREEIDAQIQETQKKIQEAKEKANMSDQQKQLMEEAKQKQQQLLQSMQ